MSTQDITLQSSDIEVRSVNDFSMRLLMSLLFGYIDGDKEVAELKFMKDRFGDVESIRCLTAGLSPRSVHVLILRYGLNDNTLHGLQLIAANLGVSVQAVSIIARDALDRMKRTAYERVYCDELSRHTGLPATPLHVLGLETRILNSLMRHKIMTVEQLSEYTANDLQLISGIGAKLVDIIMDTLEERGLRLKEY